MELAVFLVDFTMDAESTFFDEKDALYSLAAEVANKAVTSYSNPKLESWSTCGASTFNILTSPQTYTVTNYKSG